MNHTHELPKIIWVNVCEYDEIKYFFYIKDSNWLTDKAKK